VKYRKKPVVIEAMQWDGTIESADAIMRWALPESHSKASGRITAISGTCDEFLEIETLEGTMRAVPGDWIIREPFPTSDRRFYPCKPGIFAATYKPADGQPDVQTETEWFGAGRDYCTVHDGIRNEGDSGPCDLAWDDNQPSDNSEPRECVLHPLYYDATKTDRA
jgi:hypothetical protein